MRVFPLLKLKDIVDDITAFTDGRIKAFAGVSEQVPKSFRREVDEASEVVEHERRERTE